MSAQENQSKRHRRSGVASLEKAVHTVGGHLYVTDRELRFEPHIRLFSSPTVIDLSDVDSADLESALIGQKLIIRKKEGREYCFQVYGGQEWKECIDDVLDGDKAQASTNINTPNEKSIGQKNPYESCDYTDTKNEGTKVASPERLANEQAAMRTIPEHIRMHLKKFDTHQNSTCLECGYDGKMGVKASIVPWYATWWSIIAVVGVLALFSAEIFPLFGFMGAAILGLFLGVMRIAVSNTILVCPNCNSDIMIE